MTYQRAPARTFRPARPKSTSRCLQTLTIMQGLEVFDRSSPEKVHVTKRARRFSALSPKGLETSDFQILSDLSTLRATRPGTYDRMETPRMRCSSCNTEGARNEAASPLGACAPWSSASSTVSIHKYLPPLAFGSSFWQTRSLLKLRSQKASVIQNVTVRRKTEESRSTDQRSRTTADSSNTSRMCRHTMSAGRGCKEQAEPSNCHTGRES